MGFESVDHPRPGAENNRKCAGYESISAPPWTRAGVCGDMAATCQKLATSAAHSQSLCHAEATSREMVAASTIFPAVESSAGWPRQVSRPRDVAWGRWQVAGEGDSEGEGEGEGATPEVGNTQLYSERSWVSACGDERESNEHGQSEMNSIGKGGLRRAERDGYDDVPTTRRGSASREAMEQCGGGAVRGWVKNRQEMEAAERAYQWR
jgi:hypothetical protein